MRLHNRQIKAEFWVDSDLAKWPRDKRLCYVGLWQLADDSGCLEEDPMIIKGQLFPFETDCDVTSATIRQWIDEIVDEGKALRYQSGRKHCLYLVHFHDHQVLKSPSPPIVPLPPWIEWQSFSSNPRTGKYIVRQDVLTDFLQQAYTSLTPGLQSSSNQNHEPEPEPEPEHDSRATRGSAAKAANRDGPGNGDGLKLPSETRERILAAFGAKRFKTPAQARQYFQVYNKHGPDVLLRAVEWAAGRGLGLGDVARIAKAADKIAEAADTEGLNVERINGGDVAAKYAAFD